MRLRETDTPLWGVTRGSSSLYQETGDKRELWRLLVTRCFYVFRDKEVAQVTHQHSSRVCLPSIQTPTGPPSLWAAFANRFPRSPQSFLRGAVPSAARGRGPGPSSSPSHPNTLLNTNAQASPPGLMVILMQSGLGNQRPHTQESETS